MFFKIPNRYANNNETSAADEAAAAEHAAGLMLLAKMSNLSGIDTIRGACK